MFVVYPQRRTACQQGASSCPLRDVRTVREVRTALHTPVESRVDRFLAFGWFELFRRRQSVGRRRIELKLIGGRKLIERSLG